MDEPSRRVRGDLWALGRSLNQSIGILTEQGLTQGLTPRRSLHQEDAKCHGQSGRGKHLNRRIHKFSKGRKKRERRRG